MKNLSFKDQDFKLWSEYKATGDLQKKKDLIKQFEPLIYSQVKKWEGVVPTEVLTNEAKVLTAKAIDTYKANKGAALGTHITNNLAPISRIVYTYQNTARLPENITLKMQSFNAAQEHLSATLGREPTTDELRDELGWPSKEINRIKQYNHKDLVESVGGVSGDFYDSDDSQEDHELTAIYFSLTPDEKNLFEDITGFNGVPKLDTQQILKKYNLTQAQLSYKKSLITNKIANMRNR
jgi:DNA-directed RNA polymerase specialized sigma subunit